MNTVDDPKPLPETAADGVPSDPLRRAIPGIMLAVLVWGGYLAVGAFFNGDQTTYRPALKALILAGSFLLFLGFWAVMLYVRRSRLAKEE